MNDPKHRTVLYIEDNVANMQLMKKLMSREDGIEMLTATNAEDGMAIMREHKPDVILMDIHLPGMSGVDAFDELKRDETLSHIPVIAISADAIPANIQKALDKGFKAYLTKPYKLADVLSAIDDVLKD